MAGSTPLVAGAPAGVALTLSPAQIAHFAIEAGWSGNNVAIATAIALAESSGRTAVINANLDGSRDYGVWQINDHAHPDLLTPGTQWWVAGFNAQMAMQVWQQAGQSFRPWTTYKSGAYLTFMAQATTAAAHPDASMGTVNDPNAVTTPALAAAGNAWDAVTGPVQSIAGSVVKTTGWVSNGNNWVRVAYVGIGAALVIGALVLIAKPYALNAAAPELAVAQKVME